MKDVGADLADGGGRNVGGEVVDGEAGAAAADFGGVALAGHVAACLSDSGVVLQAVAAVTFLAVLDAGEGVVVLGAGAEGLAGFDGHAGGVCKSSEAEGAGVGFVGAAEVGPGVGGLAGGRNEGC